MGRYDFTVWNTDSGEILSIRENYKGCRYYVDAEDYDMDFKTKKELEDFLKFENATFVGYDSENDW